jgi:hypothetical protein
MPGGKDGGSPENAGGVARLHTRRRMLRAKGEVCAQRRESKGATVSRMGRGLRGSQRGTSRL